MVRNIGRNTGPQVTQLYERKVYRHSCGTYGLFLRALFVCINQLEEAIELHKEKKRKKREIPEIHEYTSRDLWGFSLQFSEPRLFLSFQEY
jgi:hypothetical protein